METPHLYCIHEKNLIPCRPDCPACMAESDADFANRCELAAEGGGGVVERKAGCMVTAADAFRDQVKAEIKVEAKEWEAWKA